MSNAESAAQALIVRLTSPQFLAETLAILIAIAVAVGGSKSRSVLMTES